MFECLGVLKGYGSTYEHGGDSFTTLMASAQTLAGSPEAAARLAGLRDAALADEDGATLRTRVSELQGA
jgi:indolepyruvate ferredoxin oxidoreductase beta subunit